MSGITQTEVVGKPLRWSDPDREFVGMLVHELRNGLNNIRLLRFAAEEAPDISRRSLWHAMDEVIDRMSPLLQDMLEFCRLTHGAFRLNCQRIDLRQVGRRAAHEGRRALFRRSGIKFDLDLSDNPVWTFGDQDRLTMACENLLDNALRNTAPTGRVRLTVTESGTGAMISVSDTGNGMDPALVEQLFAPFTRGGSVRSDSHRETTGCGFGLGLLFVRTVAELHGGHAAAQSHGAGLGSEFIVVLPHQA